MSDTDNQDYYEGGSADAPLIDSLGSAVKRLLDKGKARGYITVEELNKALPSERRIFRTDRRYYGRDFRYGHQHHFGIGR